MLQELNLAEAYLVINNKTGGIMYVGPYKWAKEIYLKLGQRNRGKKYHLEKMDANQTYFDIFVDTLSFSDLNP